MNKKITALVSTYNESERIEQCLESIKWADEIVVVDTESTDGTPEIARKYTKNVYSVKRTGYACREEAMKYVSNDWLLIIDADELVPVKLMKRLRKIVEEDEGDMFYIPRRNYFCGKEMLGAGWGVEQDMQLRFGKKEFFVAKDVAHEDFTHKLNARVKVLPYLDESMIHFNYYDIEQFIEKTNNYTTFEAKNMFDGKKKEIGFVKLLFQMTIEEIFKRFIIQKGYKDGLEGFTFSLLMAMYRLSAYSKYQLMKRFNSKDVRAKVRDIYREIAEKNNAQYKEELSKTEETMLPQKIELQTVN
jgi:glycosyltransferase involved in cell wall biosynthesis